MAAAIKRYGFVVALPGEARAVVGGRWKKKNGWPVQRRRPTESEEHIWVQCGIGPQRAAAAARWLVAQQVDGLAVFGVSGGLDPELVSGDLVLASEVLDCCGPEQRILLGSDGVGCDLRLLLAGLRTRCGPILTVGRPVLHAERKLEMHRRHGALAVDMESAAVARVAAEAALPCTVLRSVCDPAQRSMPEEVGGLIAPTGCLRWTELLAALFKRPRLLFDLIHMQRDFGPALRALKRAAPIVVKQVVGDKTVMSNE